MEASGLFGFMAKWMSPSPTPKQNGLFCFRVKWSSSPSNWIKMDKFATKVSPTRTEALHRRELFCERPTSKCVTRQMPFEIKLKKRFLIQI